MSNPTTPFSWQMPTATDLVTDLPADFEVFGQAVATSMADLLGGTTGQVLSKTSNTDMDFTWVAANPGDITGVTAGVGITGGGTSGTVTVTNDMATTITAAGDIVVGTGSGTYDNLPIGTTAQVLTADTTVSPYKVKWATPAGSSGPAFRAYASTNQSVSGATFTKIVFGAENFDTDNCFASNDFTPTKAGYYQLNANIETTGATGNDYFYIYKNGSDYQRFRSPISGSGSYQLSQLVYLNGTTDYANVYWYNSAITVVSGSALTSFSGVWIRS